VQDRGDAAATRTQIREIVEHRYTAPAKASQTTPPRAERLPLTDRHPRAAEASRGERGALKQRLEKMAAVGTTLLTADTTVMAALRREADFERSSPDRCF